jgi:hypothetical protein
MFNTKEIERVRKGSKRTKAKTKLYREKRGHFILDGGESASCCQKFSRQCSFVLVMMIEQE